MGAIEWHDVGMSTILIVDDDPRFGLQASDGLASNGFVVIGEAVDGLRPEAAHAVQPDFVLDIGLPALAERERAVLALMAEVRSNQAIGDGLSMARKTVEAHIANVSTKPQPTPASTDHHRVLAVLAHLRGPG
jgi:DNA-binding CsgD family transcriptional regulator